MSALPMGTITFLFTDIEGSTRLWEQHPQVMGAVVMRHDALLTAGIEQHGGLVVKSRGEGDSFFAVFARATDAVVAACTLQQALLAEPWPLPSPLQVRIALHTGEAEQREGDYYGPALNRCARLRAAAHGGQVLLSLATQELVRDAPPAGVSLKDLGLCRLRDLQRPETVFQLVHPDLPSEFPALRSLDTVPHNLPQQLASFIGREREMVGVKQLLASTRLLTLTGSGGIGKSRLSLQVAADLLDEYPDGAWLVELAALAAPTSGGYPALVPQAVATALGVREEPGQPLAQTLVNFLRSKRLLLILDNCEHLLAACAGLVEALLRSCPHLRVLASSREGLNIAGELTYRVPSLSLPDPRQLPPSLESLTQYEAVGLFIDRAVLHQPRFAVTNQNAPAVAELCHRLDGIPLAIELAAARVKALPVEQIAARLDDRFRLLTGGSRTALPRQQTLRALIDWSYNLLTDPERMLMNRLSVFSGGWTLEAAEAVCAGNGIEEWEGLDLLTSLVEKSLVLYDEQGGQARYGLLETVRQYARDRLLESGGVEAARGRHRDWFLELAERAEPELRWGAEQVIWPDRLEREHDNLRVALDWCQDAQGAAEAGLRLAGALTWFWYKRGHLAEGWQRLQGTLAQGSSAPVPVRVKALAGATMIVCLLGDAVSTTSLAAESLALARGTDDRGLLALSLHASGQAAWVRGDFDGATAACGEGLALSRAVGDRWLNASFLQILGNAAQQRGDDDQARALHEESLAEFRALGDKGGIAAQLNSLGWLSLFQDDWGEAQGLCEESLAILRELGDSVGAANTLHSLGEVARRQGDDERAAGLYQEALALARQVGASVVVASCLEGLAGVARTSEQAVAAARLYGTAAALREAARFPMVPGERADCDRGVAATRAALGEAAFAAAWADGRAMPLDQAIKVALAEGPNG